jgi:hypothetical protein
LVANRDPDRFLARTLAAMPRVDRDILGARRANAYLDAVRECSGRTGAVFD